MTKVDFYILPHSTADQRHIFACRLAEKAYKLGHKVYIHSDDEEQLMMLDQLLWSFRSASFVPHAVATSAGESSTPVLLGMGAGTSDHSGLIVNLSNSIPDGFSRFPRLAEIVVQDPQITAATRESYRFYRDRGYQLETHDLRQ